MPKSDQRSRGRGQQQSGPGRRSGSGSGRVTPKGSRGGRAQDAGVASGRYTPPIPKDQRKSPVWFGPLLLFFLIAGLLLIVLNYTGVMPGGIHNYYLIIGIVAMVVGLIMATFYR